MDDPDGQRCQWLDCSFAAPDAELLYLHLCNDHIGRKSTNNLCLTCKWKDCGTTCAKRDHITSHLRVHTPLKPHNCSVCNKKFKRPQDLKKHEKIHTEEHHAQHKHSKAITVSDPGYAHRVRRHQQHQQPENTGRTVRGSSTDNRPYHRRDSTDSPHSREAPLTPNSNLSPHLGHGFDAKRAGMDSLDASGVEMFFQELRKRRFEPTYDAQMAERLQALSTAAITQYLAQYHQAQAAMAAFQQQQQQQQQHIPSLANSMGLNGGHLAAQQHLLNGGNNLNLNLGGGVGSAFGAGGGLPTSVEELAFINNFLIKLGEQIASGDYYGAGIPPPSAAPPPHPMSSLSMGLPLQGHSMFGGLNGSYANGLGSANPAGGVGLGAGGMYDPALLAHLGLTPGLGINFPIPTTTNTQQAQQQQQQASSLFGNTNDFANAGSLYPSLFPPSAPPSATSASDASGSPLTSPYNDHHLGSGHRHRSSSGSRGTPDYDNESATSVSVGSGPPQKRASRSSGSDIDGDLGDSKRTRLDMASPSDGYHSPSSSSAAAAGHFGGNPFGHAANIGGSPASISSYRSSDSHSPPSASLDDFDYHHQQHQQQQHHHQHQSPAHVRTHDFSNGPTPTAMDFNQFSIGLGAGVGDAARRSHVPRLGTYESGLGQPLVHHVPRVQSSVRATASVTIKREEDAEDVRDDAGDDDDEEDEEETDRKQDVDSSSAGEPKFGQLRRIRVEPPTPTSSNHAHELPAAKPLLPSVSSLVSPPPKSTSHSPSPPLPSYPSLDDSLKLPALRNVGVDGQTMYYPRRTSKGSISSASSTTSSSTTRTATSTSPTPRSTSRSVLAEGDDDEMASDSDIGEDEQMRDSEDKQQITLPGVDSILAGATAGGHGHMHVDHITGDFRGIALRSAPNTPRLPSSSSMTLSPSSNSSSASPRQPARKSSTASVTTSKVNVSAEERRAHAELIGRLLVFINAEFAKRNPSAASKMEGRRSPLSKKKPTTRTSATRRTLGPSGLRASTPESSDEDEGEEEEGEEHDGEEQDDLDTPAPGPPRARQYYKRTVSDDEDEDDDEELDEKSTIRDHSPYSRGSTPQPSSLYPQLRAPIRMHRQVYAQ